MCSLRASEGVLLVVDVVEGMTSHLQALISMCLKLKKPMVLLMNKIERLVLELRLPPNDAYLKLKHILEEVNSVIE